MSNDDEVRSDRALLDRVAARDASAIAALYDRHSRLLFGLILWILRNRSEAEEVLQEVFLRAWTRIETYDTSLGSPAAWLVRIARNRAIDRLRADRLRSQPADPPAAPMPVETPETAVSSERQRAVERALGTLPAEQRELIEHAYFQGLTQSELAARFRIPLGTVKTRIRSGMMALQQSLQPAGVARERDRQYKTS
jgi:RNA polymerase sigma-70 factor, ECF subfamily